MYLTISIASLIIAGDLRIPAPPTASRRFQSMFRYRFLLFRVRTHSYFLYTDDGRVARSGCRYIAIWDRRDCVAFADALHTSPSDSHTPICLIKSARDRVPSSCGASQWAVDRHDSSPLPVLTTDHSQIDESAVVDCSQQSLDPVFFRCRYHAKVSIYATHFALLRAFRVCARPNLSMYEGPCQDVSNLLVQYNGHTYPGKSSNPT